MLLALLPLAEHRENLGMEKEKGKKKLFNWLHCDNGFTATTASLLQRLHCYNGFTATTASGQKGME
jgi:hypothetical protein